MSVSLQEVLNSVGYDLNDVDDAQWFLSKQQEIEELLELSEVVLEHQDGANDD